MSGRDPIQALMKKAGIDKMEAAEMTQHPEKAVILAAKFNYVVTLLEQGTVLPAMVAAHQAQALLEVLHALWKQDKHAELRDPKCKAKRSAQEIWDNLLNPDEATAAAMATHFRENRLNWFDTTPPYKAPPEPPKAPVDATRYTSTFVANDVEAAEKLGLPTHFVFKHGVASVNGNHAHYPYSMLRAIERKFKHRYGDWNVAARAYSKSNGSAHFGGSNLPEFELTKHEGGNRKPYVFHEVGYRLQHTTHEYQEWIEERDRKAQGNTRKSAAAKKAKA